MKTIAAALTIVLAQLEMPGTQPGELTNNLEPPSVCSSCHGGYAEYAAMDSWSGSLMANAMRDPLFLAALTIANQDIPGSGELCIRCHSPQAFLGGRAQPTDGSALVAGDYEGIQCDFCHRVVEGPGDTRNIGNGQFYVANDTGKRGTLRDAQAPHAWEHSEYHESSDLCGLCHDVSNPLQNYFAIERTYTEWKNSHFARAGVTCQACHMPREDNAYAAVPSSGVRQRRTGRHDLVGGNAWIPRVLAGEYPELGRGAAFEYTAQRAEEMLRQSAEITMSVRGSDKDQPKGYAGRTMRLDVRVENLTGHKLPTGYPEGRRSWLEVKVVGSDGRTLFHSGAYDYDTATRADDPYLRTYEVRLSSNGVEGFHFVLTDELLQDNRIPPRGFVSTPDTEPVGRTYPVQQDGTLAYWDDAPFPIRIPADAALGPATVTVTMWYQTTSREYIEFLRDKNYTDDRGQRMYELWERYGRSPPNEIATVEMIVEIEEAFGCECAAAGRAPRATAGTWLLGLVVLALLARPRRLLGRGRS